MSTPCAHPPEAVSRLFGARDYVTGREFAVEHCAGCGLDLTRPAPDPAAISEYYPPAYYGRGGSRRFPAAVEWGQRALYAWRARAVEKLTEGRPGRVLDVGCGPGALLAAFRRRGWEVQGTELSEQSAERARRAGISVHVGALDSWPWPDGHFDAVTLWHVLEHWPEPLPVLRRIQRLLRPGGVLLVGVPNFGSPEARFARDGWFHLDVPRHLVHFTDRSLGEALRACGFGIRRRSFVAPEFDTFSMVQSGLNLAGLRQNLLYNLLRGRGAKVTGPAGGAQVVATFLLGALLGAIAVPATALLAAFGRGSSMTMFAVKERG